MEKTTFEIKKMDCPCEENLLRMKLDVIEEVKNLEFDIPNRKLREPLKIPFKAPNFYFF